MPPPLVPAASEMELVMVSSLGGRGQAEVDGRGGRAPEGQGERAGGEGGGNGLHFRDERLDADAGDADELDVAAMQVLEVAADGVGAADDVDAAQAHQGAL